LEVIYGHLAEVMLGQPSTSIFLKTKEPKAGEWVSQAIGKVEIERMKETHFDGSRAGRNFTLDRQIEPVVLESEISGLPDLHAFMKYGNYVTGFSFPYLDVPGDQEPFEARELPNDKLTYDPKNVKGAKPAPAAPRPSAFADPMKPLEPAEEQGTEAPEQSSAPRKYGNDSRQNGLLDPAPYHPNGASEDKPIEQTGVAYAQLPARTDEKTVPSTGIHIGG
jgi:hypothetical protein